MYVSVCPDLRQLQVLNPCRRRVQVDSFGLLNDGRLAVFGALVDERWDVEHNRPPVPFILKMDESALLDQNVLAAVFSAMENHLKLGYPYVYLSL